MTGPSVFLRFWERTSFTRLLLLTMVAALYFSASSAYKSKNKYEVCESQSCKDIADELLSGMDPTVYPCDDFYKYVCGSWAKNHPAAVYIKKWTHFGIIANKTNIRLRNILETESTSSEETAVKKAKQLYRACMHTDRIEHMGLSTILNFMDRTGGWPIIMNPLMWQINQKPWQTVDSEYNVIMGTSPIFNLMIRPDLRSSDRNVLHVSPPWPGNVSPVPISKNLHFFFNEPSVASYIKFIMDIARVMGRDRRTNISELQLRKDAEGIVLFESYLRAIRAAADNNTALEADITKLHRVTTIAQFQRFYDFTRVTKPTGKINWLQRIRELFAQTSNIKIDSWETLVVHNDNYFQRLAVLLDHTSERDIVNSIHWWFAKQTLSYSSRKIIEMIEKYTRGDSPGQKNLTPSAPRWLKCTTENELQHAVASAYVKKYFPENAKDTALEMIHQIEAEMKKQISESKWLDEHTKQAAREKIVHMSKFIGYPDWYKESTVMDQRYEKLSIGPDYLENMLLVKRFSLQQELESLRKPVDKWSWIASPMDINAYYSPVANSLTFPAGILQMPFFDAEHPDAVNYGGIGTIIAHEISHGFDNIGSQFDKNGNAIQWWSDETRLEYKKRSQCFVDQFNNYKLFVNNVTYGGLGYHTLGENIADSTGIRAVFHAYKTHMKNPDYKEVKLPGFEHLSAEELFFVSYAGSMCEDVKQEFLISLISQDPHCPSPMRVVGSLSNSEDFSQTFKCPKGTVMNPPKKCGIWY